MLVAAMNPCPCGYLNDPERECKCSGWQVDNYSKKVSGPILDRIDLHLNVPRVKIEKLVGKNDLAESSAEIQQRVQMARDAQIVRLKKYKITCNAEMSSRIVKEVCHLDDASSELLKQVVQKENLSGRSYFRLLKVARTIADLNNSVEINLQHIGEAISYRVG
jgi:magnesium chelatase family protein